MNRNELVEQIMKSAGLTKANVNRFYAGLVELAKKELVKNNQFVLPGLGALRVRVRKARIGRNPRTGEPIKISRKRVVRFRAYRQLSELLNPSGARDEPTPEGSTDAPPADAPQP